MYLYSNFLIKSNKMEDINLLPKIGFENLSRKAKFFYWTTKYGRAIVISFQAIVITLLFYKLYLYTNFIDISETIEEKTAILKSQTQTEKDLKDTQQKILALKSARADSFIAKNHIELIKKVVPKDIKITTLILENTSIRFTAHSQNLYLFSQLIENISKEKQVVNITLLGAQFSEENNEFTFDIELVIKKI